MAVSRWSILSSQLQSLSVYLLPWVFCSQHIGVWVHFWVFNSIPLIYLSVIVPVPYNFYHNGSVVQLEVRHGDSTRGSFIVENSFCYPSFFVIADQSADCLSNSLKN